MLYYPNQKVMPQPMNNQNDRFIVPFLLGGLAGGAAVGLTRPRPIYNVAPYPGPGPGPFNPYRPYASYSYSYYVPYANSYPY